MASRRMISRSLGSSEKFARIQESVNGLADFCHALFPLLVANADDLGRLQGDAFTVKHTCFPVSNHSVSDFEDALLALHRTGLLARYLSGRRWYVQIINFKQHQPGLLKTEKSQLPGPDAKALEHIREFSRFPEPSRTFQNFPEDAGKSQKTPSKEGRKEGRSNARSSGYLDRSGTLEQTPLPPFLSKRGNRRKRLTRAELDTASRWRKNSLKPCQHEPKCSTVDACVERIAYWLREEKHQ